MLVFRQVSDKRPSPKQKQKNRRKGIDQAVHRIECAFAHAGLDPEEWLIKLMLRCQKLVAAATRMQLFAKVRGGILHVFLGKSEDGKQHGHIICILAEQAITYARGYNEPRGEQNCCYITL